MFDISLAKLESQAINYATDVKKSFVSDITNTMSSFSTIRKYETLNEFAQEHIDQNFDCELLINTYIDGLYYDEETMTITCETLNKIPLETCPLILGDLLKYIEYGVKNTYGLNAPTITPAIKKAENYINDIKNFLDSLKNQ